MPRPSLTEARGVTGDVLVRAVPSGAHLRYTLSEIPGPDQIRCTSLADAARQARDYARHRGVDVWTDDGAGHVVRLSRFRASGFTPNRPGAQALTPPAAACAHADAVERDLTDGPPPS